MKKLSLLLFVFALAVINLSLLESVKAQKNPKLLKVERAIPNRYIVVLNDDVAKVNEILPSAVKIDVVSRVSRDLTSSYGGRVDKVFPFVLRGYAAEMSAEIADRLSRDPRVKYVEEDFLVVSSETQNSAPFGLDRIDQRTRPLNSTYTYTATGSGVHVYVLDSGIRATHSEFTGRLGNGTDLVNDGQNGNDCDGHGTHVAGTIGGTTYGVAKQATIHSIRVLNCEGKSTGSSVIEGMNWVSANRISPSVVNMSLGGSYSVSFNNAVTQAVSQGVTYVVAAGNENNDACDKSPSSSPAAITVGSMNSSDSRSSFSNYGSCVDIFAPGTAILSAGIASDTATATFNGTSMASPHVAGVVAQFLQLNPTASPSVVASSIINNATSGVLTNIGAGSPNLLLFTPATLNTAPTPVPVPSPAPAVLINESGPSTPYPSTFTVSGLSGVVSPAAGSIQVRINNFSHTYSPEVAMVLEGPTGARLLLQRGAGSTSDDTNNVTYTISDSGASQMSTDPLTNGATYKPTALTSLPSFPAPGPLTAYNNPGPVNGGTATLSSTFGNTAPNGVWKLYVMDLDRNDRGRILSWSLDISTAALTPATATFVGFDRANQGNWLGKYAAQGVSIPGDATNLPSFVQFSATNQNTHVWANSTTDSRALFKASNNSSRIASTLYTSGTFNAGQFELNFNFTDGQPHRLALYALDWDNQNRQQIFELVNTATGAVLDTRAINNFGTGVYVIWNVQGQVTVRVRNGGANSLNAVLSGVFIDPPSATVPAPPYPTTASFVNFDTTTHGDWLGKYAAQGVSIPGDATSFPNFVQFSVAGHNTHVWANSTPDVRALSKATNNSDRIASTLYTSGTFNDGQFDLNFNFTDGQSHRLALYALDWDNQNRRQIFELINTSTGAVIDTRTLSNFGNGVYVVWNVQGQFTVRVKNGGANSLNAVLSGVFVDPPVTVTPPPAYPTAASFISLDTTSQGNWLGKYASQGVSIPGDATSFPNFVQFSVAGHNTHVWANSTTDVRALSKASNNSDRIASTLYTSGTFNTFQFELNFNFTDGQPHRLTLYSLDWDNQNRQQTFEIVNTSTGEVLDSRTISNFSNGVYASWNARGRFTVRVRNSGANSLNAVLSGVFIDSL